MRKFTFSLPSNLLILALFALNIFSFESYAQVGIGTTTPQAMLDVVASDPDNPTAKDGFLMPRVTSLSQDFQSTTIGTMVFYTGSTGTGNGNMKNTIYFFDGNNWKNMSGESASTTDPKSLYDWDAVHKGVVYWIDPSDPYHYKIVSPYQTGSIMFGDENSGNVDCATHHCDNGNFDTKSKTSAWISSHSGLNSSNYADYVNSAAHYFNGVNGVGNTALGWSTPTTEELLFIVQNRSSINTEFGTSAGSYTAIDNATRYWSCEQYTGTSGADAVFVLDDEGFYTTKDNLASNIAARFVKEIGQ